MVVCGRDGNGGVQGWWWWHVEKSERMVVVVVDGMLREGGHDGGERIEGGEAKYGHLKPNIKFQLLALSNP